MLIRVGDAFKRAMQAMAASLQQRQDGLYVPPQYIAGKHFGGFGGYDEWVQDCIRAVTDIARGVPPDEISEAMAWVLWTPFETDVLGNVTGGGPIAHVDKYPIVMRKMFEFAERVTEGRAGLTQKITDQIERVAGTRQRGTLMVVAMKLKEETGEVMASVSAWSVADLEEALAVPKQQYGRTYG